MLITKRLNDKRFTWPKAQASPISLSKVQLDALFEGIGWTKLAINNVRRPSII